MKLADLTKQAGEWLRGSGPMEDVVISCRARLARNLAGEPFLSRCSQEQKKAVEARLKKELLGAGIAPTMLYVDLAAAGDLDRRLLVERHLISREHAAADHPRGVAVAAGETVAVMVNEEDHLRIQAFRCGLQMPEALADALRVDNLLEEHVDFAFHSRYGYLTACPTNVGTGLRLSAMLHLPALKMAGEIEKALRAAKELHLEVRGLYGEGTEALGDFFQVSNQTSLGHSEEQIADEFAGGLIPKFVEYERQARQILRERQGKAVEDKIQRSLALLRSARMMSNQEATFLLSLVRLGIATGLVRDVDIKTVNEIFLLTQPAHLQKILKQELDGPARAEARATYIRQRLGAH
ncbi:MAG: protein arginine kinase [Phycisphaerae bacterium]|jgi:protein arginine kinase